MEKEMEKLHVDDEKKPKAVYGNAPLLAKKPRNKAEDDKTLREVQVETNIRRLIVAKNISLYKYIVIIYYVYRNSEGKDVAIEVSKCTKRGAEHERNKARCQRVYELVIKMFPEFGNGGACFYDRQSSLYSLNLLTDEKKMTATITKNVSTRPNFVRAEFHLSRVADSFQTTTNDVNRTFDSCPRRADKTLHEVLNMMISQPAFDNKNVVTVGQCVHYLWDHTGTGIDELKVTQGNRTASVGTTKAVKTLQGTPNGDQPAALFLTNELKTTMFHPDSCTVLDVLASFNGFSPNLQSNTPNALKLLKAVIGLEVYPNYGVSKGASFEEALILKIREIGNSANKETFLCDEKPTTVAQYFKKKYNVNLQYPDLFTIQTKGKSGQKMMIPAECLQLCPNQIVTNEQMIGSEQSEMIKLSALKPTDRKDATNAVARTVGIASSKVNDHLTVGATETVKGIVLPKPDIVFGGNRKVNWDPTKRVPTDFTAAGHYIIPMKLTNWELVFMRNECLQDVDRLLVNEMKSSGMVASNPVITEIQCEEDLERVFAAAQKNQRQLLFFCTKSKYDFHQRIKALEQQYDVLTQDIRWETAQKMRHQPQTRKNIVNKTNLKLGGLNFLVNSEAFRNPNRLIIGFETSSKNGGSPDLPIAIGFSANMMARNQQFCGGYVYVKRTSDVYGQILTDTVLHILKTVIAKRGRPNEIFVYFSGVTEGQYGLINELYLEAVKQACIDTKIENFFPQITLIAASKTHNERFYQGNSNLEPGTIIDHTVVSPVFNEFYLASSVARQGTAKVAKYTVICSTNKNLNMKQYETLTYDLCFEHQIVFHPISLPIPLYLAGKISQRGAMVLSMRGATYTDGVLDLDTTNDRLSYKNKKCGATRFNA